MAIKSRQMRKLHDMQKRKYRRSPTILEKKLSERVFSLNFYHYLKNIKCRRQPKNDDEQLTV